MQQRLRSGSNFGGNQVSQLVLRFCGAAHRRARNEGEEDAFPVPPFRRAGSDERVHVIKGPSWRHGRVREREKKNA